MQIPGTDPNNPYATPPQAPGANYPYNPFGGPFNPDGSPNEPGFGQPGYNAFQNTNYLSTPGTNTAVGYNTGLPGQVGSGGGIGKTGGFMGIGNENVQQQLEAIGYVPYTATSAPNVSSLFTTNQAPEQQFRGGEVNLMNQLATTAGGGGPSASGSELQAGTNQTVANQMALAASGRGTPGTMAGATSAGVAAGQTAADQAATLRAQEIQSAQGQLGGITGTGAAGDLGEQSLMATQGAGLAGIDTSQWSYLNSLNAGQQSPLNAVIANSVTGSNSAQQAMVPQAIGGGSGAAGALVAAHGAAVTDGPEVRLIGEAGPEAVVPIDSKGRPDMSRATDPKLKWILDSHGYEKSGTQHEAPPDHGLLGQIMALRQDIQRLSQRGA